MKEISLFKRVLFVDGALAEKKPFCKNLLSMPRTTWNDFPIWKRKLHRARLNAFAFFLFLRLHEIRRDGMNQKVLLAWLVNDANLAFKTQAI